MSDDDFFQTFLQQTITQQQHIQNTRNAQLLSVHSFLETGVSLRQPEPNIVRHRRSVYRRREENDARFMNEYFSDRYDSYTIEQFDNRYRMNRALFERINGELSIIDDRWPQLVDGTSRQGHSSHAKTHAALRILAYGTPADAVDEYIKIAKTTAINYMKLFCRLIVGHFGPRYLRRPTYEDMQRILKENEQRGFPGMLGSVDCYHWQWKNCPVSQHGTHRGGHKKVPSLILEASATYDLWIWHSFFGTPGASNDLNVLDGSTLFEDVEQGNNFPVNFTVNGHQYNLGYYLADGIYPNWAGFVKPFTQPHAPAEKYFNSQQMGKRKDVERAFAVLGEKWQIVYKPVKYWDKEDLGYIMKTCIILHNMIIDDERRDPDWANVTNVPNLQGMRPAVLSSRDRQLAMERIENEEIHYRLRTDLLAHLWARRGDLNVVQHEHVAQAP